MGSGFFVKAISKIHPRHASQLWARHRNIKSAQWPAALDICTTPEKTVVHTYRKLASPALKTQLLGKGNFRECWSKMTELTGRALPRRGGPAGCEKRPDRRPLLC